MTITNKKPRNLMDGFHATLARVDKENPDVLRWQQIPEDVTPFLPAGQDHEPLLGRY